MRIISLGNLATEAVYRHTCQHCETVFEFQRHEANLLVDNRDGSCLVIECPGCRRAAYVAVKAGYQGPG